MRVETKLWPAAVIGGGKGQWNSARGKRFKGAGQQTQTEEMFPTIWHEFDMNRRFCTESLILKIASTWRSSVSGSMWPARQTATLFSPGNHASPRPCFAPSSPCLQSILTSHLQARSRSQSSPLVLASSLNIDYAFLKTVRLSLGDLLGSHVTSPGIVKPPWMAEE